MSKLFTIQCCGFLACLVIVFAGCSKKSGNPPNENLYIPGRVLEHGSNQPLVSAETIQRVCKRYDFGGCSQWEESMIPADPSGKFTFLRSKFRNHQVRKTGYWTFIDEPDACNPFGFNICDQPADVTYYTSAGQTDSLLIKLFPVTIVTAHVRNNGPATDAVLNRTNRFGTRGVPVQLRAGIDSTFQMAVFGNTDNHLYVFRKSPFNDTVAVQARFIAKSDILSFDFFY